MITLEGTLRVVLTGRPCHVADRRELLAAILTSVLTFLASFIKDVIPFKRTEGMLLARRHNHVPYTGEIFSAINTIEPGHKNILFVINSGYK